MPKRSRKVATKERRTSKSHRAERDPNQAAFDAVQRIIEQTEQGGGKNPLAVALGRLGGLKGGRARADNMTKADRKASAIKAARARWDAQKGDK